MQLPGFGDTSDLQTYTALPPLVFEDSEYLFLMTMPSFDSEARKFYFADTGNHFWKVMAAIYKMPAETSEERTALCKANKIAIWSVLKSCKRHLSQQDTTTDEVYNDMAGFLKEHPTIKKTHLCIKDGRTRNRRGELELPGGCPGLLRAFSLGSGFHVRTPG